MTPRRSRGQPSDKICFSGESGLRCGGGAAVKQQQGSPGGRVARCQQNLNSNASLPASQPTSQPANQPSIHPSSHPAIQPSTTTPCLRPKPPPPPPPLLLRPPLLPLLLPPLPLLHQSSLPSSQ
ncbi:hypothetical protein E2C01_089230 [Portunus trituberculatus]|uniref:Uncharacterized protein n=1 Tax=Portunus trituberculatus TaxID=210409 RepID=A0A5B7JLV6_PORTR|nr:hypothetical protein [Portunus trituberculatus]